MEFFNFLIRQSIVLVDYETNRGKLFSIQRFITIYITVRNISLWHKHCLFLFLLVSIVIHFIQILRTTEITQIWSTNSWTSYHYSIKCEYHHLQFKQSLPNQSFFLGGGESLKMHLSFLGLINANSLIVKSRFAIVRRVFIGSIP